MLDQEKKNFAEAAETVLGRKLSAEQIEALADAEDAWANTQKRIQSGTLTPDERVKQETAARERHEANNRAILGQEDYAKIFGRRTAALAP